MNLHKSRNKIIGLLENKAAAQRRNQKGQGVKILTLQVMLSRLPISLA